MLMLDKTEIDKLQIGEATQIRYVDLVLIRIRRVQNGWIYEYYNDEQDHAPQQTQFVPWLGGNNLDFFMGETGGQL